MIRNPPVLQQAMGSGSEWRSHTLGALVFRWPHLRAEVGGRAAGMDGEDAGAAWERLRLLCQRCQRRGRGPDPGAGAGGGGASVCQRADQRLLDVDHLW